MATICVLISAYELGSMSTIFAALAYAINQLIIIILAFHFGYARVNRIEAFYFSVSIFSLMAWAIFSHIPEIPGELELEAIHISIIVLITNTLIDFMGSTAIFTKLYKDPESEDTWAWFLCMISGLFSIIAVENYTVHDLIYPLYLFLSNLAIWFLCFRKRPKHRFEKIFNLVEKVV